MGFPQNGQDNLPKVRTSTGMTRYPTAAYVRPKTTPARIRASGTPSDHPDITASSKRPAAAPHTQQMTSTRFFHRFQATICRDLKIAFFSCSSDASSGDCGSGKRGGVGPKAATAGFVAGRGTGGGDECPDRASASVTKDRSSAPGDLAFGPSPDPQLEQKAAVSELLVPQAGQVRGCGARLLPQVWQNRASSGLEAPQ